MYLKSKFKGTATRDVRLEGKQVDVTSQLLTCIRQANAAARQFDILTDGRAREVYLKWSDCKENHMVL